VSAGERPPELIGTRWAVQLDAPPSADVEALHFGYGDSVVVGDAATWARAAERVR